MSHDLENDPELTPQQEIAVNKLTEEEIKEIDNMLISNTTSQWRKIARIVGMSMISFESKFTNIPDIFFAIRIKILVKRNKLESQGNIQNMRYSEVRRIK